MIVVAPMGNAYSPRHRDAKHKHTHTPIGDGQRDHCVVNIAQSSHGTLGYRIWGEKKNK